MSDKFHLTEPQQRHITTGLKLIDKAVRRIEYVLERGVRHTGPSGVQASLDQETIEHLRTLMHQLQDDANELYRKYGGRGKPLNLDRVLDAELSSLWEMLEDSRPERMRGYGPMDAETAHLVEADMQRLLQLVLRARSLLLSSSREKDRSDQD
ncbi:MAG TPA: hypothetical protein VNN18_00240 [Candidatus Xenobia bacterium]|nr:hypothetical protein [Candidatus Xenobia bacterium]